MNMLSVRPRLTSSIVRSALAALVCVMLAACASTSALEPQNQPLSSRAARIYILRPPAAAGGIYPATIKINGADVGSVANNSYLSVDRPAGRYKISAVISTASEDEVEVHAGRSHYFAINVKGSAAPLGGISIPIEGSSIGRPLRQPGLFEFSWLSEVDASQATAIMSRMKPPK